MVSTPSKAASRAILPAPSKDEEFSSVVAEHPTPSKVAAREFSDAESSEEENPKEETISEKEKAALEALASCKEQANDCLPQEVLLSFGHKLRFSAYQFSHLKSALKWKRMEHLNSKK
uniref:Uncharacterized protein n=1 Tax=Amphora coffeiformis TaxID=265554 RepID=A0A7S3L8X8_9STRA